MALDVAAMLRPISAGEPCGPSLRYHDDFVALRELAAGDERAEWARVRDQALSLAGQGHDLRVWVWVCRAGLCSDGLAGLADGLDLIAQGSARYWDELPPFDPDETTPEERFLGRINALTELGITSHRANLADLMRVNRNLTDLRADLDRMIARTVPDAAAKAALERCHAAMAAIGETFRTRFGDGHDPQLGFEFLAERLTALTPKFGAVTPPVGSPAAAAAGGSAAPAAHAALGPVTSRDDVVRALNLVLEYYHANEPSSPVPLLVARARKLVTMSFLEAMKDLAPAGLKELQAVAGTTEEKK
jgi:type VI secretion system protein ImpA